MLIFEERLWFELSGFVLTRSCRLLPGAVVDLWHCQTDDRQVPPDATRLTRKQGAHSIFWKTTPHKVVFGYAKCPKVRFYPGSSCPQQPP